MFEVDPSAPRPHPFALFLLASWQSYKPAGYRGGVQASMLKPDRGLRTGPRHAAPDTVWTDRLIAGCVFGGLFFVYLAVSRHTFVAYDASSMVALGTNITNHFTLTTVGAFDDYLHLSTPYSPYGIGISLLVVPMYALSKLTGNEMLLLSLINPLLTAAAGAVVFAIGKELRWARTMSVLAAATFGLLTMALQSTTELFSEPAVALCIVILVWAILRWRQEWQWAALVIGLTSAAVIQFRNDSILTVWIGLLALPMFVSWTEIRRPRSLAAMGIPVVLSLAFLGWYNHYRFKNYLVFSYGGQGFHNAFGRGIEGMLVSPGKSIFVFNPIALLGVVGIIIFMRRDRPIAVLFLLLIVPRILFFAKWDSWDGGVAWGPRFLDPIVALFVIAAVEVLVATRHEKGWGIVARVAFGVLALLSLGVSFLSVRVPYEQWWQTISNPALRTRYDGGHLVPDPNAPGAVSNAFDFTLQGGHLMGDIHLLENGTAETAPWDFQSGREAEGWLLLAAGLALTTTGAVLALKADKRQREHGIRCNDSAAALDP
jgi:hypothetical protein